MKNKKIYIFILFIGFIIFLFYSVHKELNQYNYQKEQYEPFVNECNIVINENNVNSEEYIRCKTFLDSYKGDEITFFGFLTCILLDYVYNIIIVIIIIIDIFAIKWIHKVFKNKYIINYYMKMSNKDFLKKLLKESYIYIVPIILAFLIFLIFILLRSTIIVDTGSLWSLDTMKNPILFIIIYLLQLSLFLGTYINMGLIVSRKNFNYILSLISAYFLFIILELFDEIVLGNILKINNPFYFSIANCFAYDDSFGIFSPIYFPLGTFVISLLIVLCLYKNKEKLYLDIENRR